MFRDPSLPAPAYTNAAWRKSLQLHQSGKVHPAIGLNMPSFQTAPLLFAACQSRAHLSLYAYEFVRFPNSCCSSITSTSCCLSSDCHSSCALMMYFVQYKTNVTSVSPILNYLIFICEFCSSDLALLLLIACGSWVPMQATKALCCDQFRRLRFYQSASGNELVLKRGFLRVWSLFEHTSVSMSSVSTGCGNGR